MWFGQVAKQGGKKPGLMPNFCKRGKEEDEDFRSENGLIISYLVVELFSKIRFRAVVVAFFWCMALAWVKC